MPEVNITYNPSATTRSPGELADAVSNKIIAYETNYLSRFGQRFRYSKFLQYIETVDNAIVSTTANIRLRKTFLPNVTGINSYNLTFNQGLQRLGLSSDVQQNFAYGCLNSSQFI
jgi:hypothetical protein